MSATYDVHRNLVVTDMEERYKDVVLIAEQINEAQPKGIAIVIHGPNGGRERTVWVSLDDARSMGKHLLDTVGEK